MNSPLKDLAMKIIEAGDDLIRFRAEASTTARDYAENSGWFSNQKVQKHESFMVGAKWGLEKGLSANHADQLARACLVMRDALMKNRCDFCKGLAGMSCARYPTCEAIDQANKICAGRE